MFLENCEIISKEYLTENQFILELKSDLISKNAMPGQFVNVTCDSLLKRPISIYNVDLNKGTFFLGIRIKGSGTTFLEKQKIGDVLNVLGPLGHGFDFKNVKKVIAVGGGIGIFPLVFLLSKAKEKGIKTVSICGFKSIDQAFCISELKNLSDDVIFASESGDMDFEGNAFEALKQVDFKDSTIFTCGPNIMMKFISEFAKINNIPCQVSLEQRMGCGTGVCLVCACKIKVKNSEKEDDFEYKRCCKEGPVFNGDEVIWD